MVDKEVSIRLVVSEGTPRQEYQEGLVDGIRVRQVFNPYVKMDNYQTNVVYDFSA